MLLQRIEFNCGQTEQLLWFFSQRNGCSKYNRNLNNEYKKSNFSIQTMHFSY